MKDFDIFIAYVAWENGGKFRPVLVISQDDNNVTALNITTQFADKSGDVKAHYFEIVDWQKAKLKQPSYVDTLAIVNFSKVSIAKSHRIGKLSGADKKRLIEFTK